MARRMSKRLVLYAGDDKARENGSKSASKRVVKLFPFSRRRRANRETRRNGVEADGQKPFRHADQVWDRAPEERKKFDAYGVSKRPPSAAQQPGKAAVERPSERKRPAGPTRVVDLGGLTPLELKVLVRYLKKSR